MSAINFFRSRNRGASSPSVSELVKYYELLSDTSSLLSGTTARDGGAAGAGQGRWGSRPLEQRDDQEECGRPAHGCGTRQLTPSGNRGSGDHNSGSGEQAPLVARFYDLRGSGDGVRVAGNNASCVSPLSWPRPPRVRRRDRFRRENDRVGRDNVARVTVYVAVHPGSDQKPRTGEAAFDVSNSGTVRNHLQVDIEWDDNQ
ncbi:unnamed protein product [Macrosiphum euphorbiae]|uniref:Uncharacterized protein n=1 Tax=Macrosiphum euphorbiae TaxID=13131 RepID=A0AAV0VT32_9HEMI|nr:unnamed protein product [Macrosiphum euphorbiae]